MKNYWKQLACTLIITLSVAGSFAFVAHAQTAPAPAPTQGRAASGSVPASAGDVVTLFGKSLTGLLTGIAAYVANLGISLAGWLVFIAGALLNFSINLTLNIKSFVDNTEAVYTTWRAIRDISSLIIIFFLLWFGLQLILGLETHKFGNYLKSVVIAGLLINFSFFLASVGIDASNIVSLQLYNAIAPANSLNVNAGATGLGADSIKSSITDGGLSDIFMKSLQITSIYNTKLAPGASDTTGNISAPFKIIFMGVIAIMIEIFAAASFLAASIAFIFRFVILIVLLAFSPIWIAGTVIPKLDEYAKDWWNHYKSMLLFMPVYLLLMYMALNVLTTSTVLRNGYAGNLIAGPAGDSWYSNILVLAINAFIVIFLLNMPLVVAISLGGKATSWIKGSGLTGGAVWKRMGVGLQRNSLGRAASKIADTEGFRNIASKNRVAAAALKGTRLVAQDYNKKLASQVEARAQFANSLGYNQNAANEQQKTIRETRQRIAEGTIDKTLGDKQIRDAQSKITEVKNARKFEYAKTINSGSYDTLYLYKARKNKVAASKLHAEVWEAELKDEKEKLKDAKNEVGTLEKQMKNRDDGGTDAQKELMKPLKERQTNLQNEVDRLEVQIGKARLTK